MKLYLPSRPLVLSMLVFTAITGTVSAALITTEENFNSTTPGTLPAGWQTNSGTTTAAVGVNGTNAYVTANSQGGAFQTTATFNLTLGTTYDFNASFFFTGSGQITNNGIFGIGFSDTILSVNNNGGDDRMMVAVAAAGTAQNYSLATGGQFSTMVANRRAGSTFTLATNVWYTLSGSVSYTDGTSTFNFTNLSLVNIGATGTSAPGANLFDTTSVSTVVSAGNGINLSDTAAKFGVFVSGSGRGSTTLDNVNAIPEPSTWLLVACSLTLLITLRKRKSS